MSKVVLIIYILFICLSFYTTVKNWDNVPIRTYGFLNMSVLAHVIYQEYNKVESYTTCPKCIPPVVNPGL